MKSSVVGLLSLAAVLVGSAGSPLGRPALAGELAGVTMANTLKAGDKTLKLNGLGLRKKAVFTTYRFQPPAAPRRGDARVACTGTTETDDGKPSSMLLTTRGLGTAQQ